MNPIYTGSFLTEDENTVTMQYLKDNADDLEIPEQGAFETSCTCAVLSYIVCDGDELVELHIEQQTFAKKDLRELRKFLRVLESVLEDD
jgi:hypothetical protein